MYRWTRVWCQAGRHEKTADYHKRKGLYNEHAEYDADQDQDKRLCFHPETRMICDLALKQLGIHTEISEVGTSLTLKMYEKQPQNAKTTLPYKIRIFTDDFI